MKLSTSKALLISLGFFSCHFSNAQQKRLISHFEGFLGSSFLHNNGYLGDSKPKFGYTYGIGLYNSVSESFQINVRAGYDRKGSVYRYNYSVDTRGKIDEVQESVNTDFDYLSVSVMPQFLAGKKQRFVFGIGGYYSWLRVAHMEFTRVTNSSSTVNGFYLGPSFSQNVKGIYNHQYDYGVSISAGYSIPFLHKNKILIQASENLGFVDINCPQIGSQRNRSFTISTSVVINRRH